MSPDPQIVGFDSIQDAFDYMRKSETAANAGLHEKQKALTWGQYWVRFWDVASKTLIFGKVMTVEEFAQAEAEAAAASKDPMALGEMEHEVAALRQRHGRGYLFGYCWSTIEPNGELGDTHQANVWPISEELFEAAKAANWVIDDLDQTAKVRLSNAYLEWGAHQRDRIDAHRANGGS
jgi:hypothetical protein